MSAITFIYKLTPSRLTLTPEEQRQYAQYEQLSKPLDNSLNEPIPPRPAPSKNQFTEFFGSLFREARNIGREASEMIDEATQGSPPKQEPFGKMTSGASLKPIAMNQNRNSSISPDNTLISIGSNDRTTPKGNEDYDIQLALALSLSLQEEERKKELSQMGILDSQELPEGLLTASANFPENQAVITESVAAVTTEPQTNTLKEHD